VEQELCDAVALARAALSATPSAPAGVELRDQTGSQGIPIYTDPVLVVRVLQNLVSNAVKFTPRGTVSVRVRPLADGPPGPGAEPAVRGPWVAWEVEDSGIGIAPEDQRAIFDEFRQVDGSATRRFGGAGLGLALSQGLAHRLGGEIRVESAPGEGSTFPLLLPASVVRAGDRPRDPEAPSATDTPEEPR